MSLLARIETDLTTALKSGDNFGRDTLRFLKSVIKNAEIDSSDELTDDRVVGLIQKEVKKRLEAVALFNQAAKPDLAASEQAEAKFLQRYLPEQMSEAQIKATVTEYLTANTTEAGQIGQAMGELSAKLKGQADLGIVAKVLRQQIQNG